MPYSTTTKEGRSVNRSGRVTKEASVGMEEFFAISLFWLPKVDFIRVDSEVIKDAIVKCVVRQYTGLE